MRKRAARTHTSKPSTTLKVAGIFICIVVLLIVFSLCIKVWLLFSKSQFDGQHQYIVHLTDGSDHTHFIFFNPDVPKIEVLAIDGSITSETILSNIPSDAKLDMIFSEDSLQDSIHTTLVKAKNINFIDKLRLLLFAQTIAKDDIHMTHLKLPVTSSEEEDTKNIAVDQSLYKEGVSIAVVNASGFAGLGNTTATMLEEIGANVISVTTADQENETSSLVNTGEATYTLRRLTHIFSINPKMISKQQLATITIILGKDAKEKLKNI